MNWEPLIRSAGAGMLLIALANAIAPRLLDYRRNMARCDRVVAQIFHVHAIYIVATILGMAALCLWRPEFFRAGEVGRAAAGFLGLFWGSRFFVQMIYYDQGIKRRYPLWNMVFLAAFFALGAGFLTVALVP